MTHPHAHPFRPNRGGLIAFFTMLGCLAFGPIACGPDADDLQDEAVAAIKALKGKVQRDTTKPGKPVIGVELRGPDIHNTSLAILDGLPHLQSLRLERTKVTDAGLSHLPTVPDLQRLYLFDTAITDAGVVHVRKIKRLRVVNLSGTKVSDEGAEALGSARPGLTIAR